MRHSADLRQFKGPATIRTLNLRYIAEYSGISAPDFVVIGPA